MKKIMFMFVFVILLFSTSFGYTLTIKKGDYVLTREGIVSGTLLNVGYPEGFSYTSNCNEVERVSGNLLQLSMPTSNVEIELSCLNVIELAIGDYITFHQPDSTFTYNEWTFNPGCSWRIASVSEENVVAVSKSLGNVSASGQSGCNSWIGYGSNILAKCSAFNNVTNVRYPTGDELMLIASSSGSSFYRPYSNSGYGSCSGHLTYYVGRWGCTPTSATEKSAVCMYGCSRAQNGSGYPCNGWPIAVTVSTGFPVSGSVSLNSYVVDGSGTSEDPFVLWRLGTAW